MLIMVAFMALGISANTFSAEAAAKKKAGKNIAEATFVTSIDCKNCVKKVEGQLPFVEGIKDMKVSLAEKKVWVKYDTRKTNPEKIAEAIAKIGYTAKLVSETPAK